MVSVSDALPCLIPGNGTNITYGVTGAGAVAGSHGAELIPRGAAVLGATIGVLIIAIGAFGNILVILAVLKCRTLLKASNMFVVSLAICDAFQTILVRPLFIHTYIIGYWSLSGRWCLYALYASNLAILESILHVSAIAFYRYVILVHPRAARHFQKPRAVVLLICIIFVLPLVIVLAPSGHTLLSASAANIDQMVVFDTRIMFCSRAKTPEFSPAGIIKKAAFLGAAAVFLFYCYIRIYVKVRQSGRLVNSIDGSFSPVRVRREITLLKTIIVVFVTFVTSYLPVTILYAVDETDTVPYVVCVIAVLLLWASSSVNWMIYGLMNNQYRQAYRCVLCGNANYAASSGMTNDNGSNASGRLSHNPSVRETTTADNTKPNGYSTLELT